MPTTKRPFAMIAVPAALDAVGAALIIWAAVSEGPIQFMGNELPDIALYALGGIFMLTAGVVLMLTVTGRPRSGASKNEPH